MPTRRRRRAIMLTIDDLAPRSDERVRLFAPVDLAAPDLALDDVTREHVARRSGCEVLVVEHAQLGRLAFVRLSDVATLDKALRAWHARDVAGRVKAEGAQDAVMSSETGDQTASLI